MYISYHFLSYLAYRFLEWEVFQKKNCRDNHNTLYIHFFPPENLALYNSKNYGRDSQVTDDNTIGRMRSPCWVTKATYIRAENVTLIAFPQQKFLRERTSTLLLYHNVCLFYYLTSLR
jgi:hypothetical protein